MLSIGYKFRNLQLLSLALTQSGVDPNNNNERLEFVGDRVLGLTVAQMLYTMYPDEKEGELARRHSVLVSTDTLARVARKIELDRSLHHGHMTGGRTRHVLANAMEAVLGAVFIDGGFDAARDVIMNLWHDLATADAFPPKDAKTKLQEYVQKNDNGALPIYEFSETVGASHCPTFNVTVTAMGKSATGSGASKKAAGIAAATELLKILAI